MGSELMLAIKEVKKSFGELEVLRGVSLEVARGEVVAVLGSSGSGKTTLLRCVNLLEEFEEGEIIIDGQTIGYELVNGRRRRKKEVTIARQRTLTGMAFQSFNLFPHLTALENVTLGLRKVAGMSKAEAAEVARRWLARVDLTNREDHYPGQLSGGQQQRVAIARAIAMNPKLMLFDEVTSALDPELVGEVLKTIKNLADEGMTMLLVTHEINFARHVADRIVFMNQGRIEEQGPPERLLDEPESPTLRKFLGSMSTQV